MAQCHEHRSSNDCDAVAKQAIGKQAAKNRRNVNQGSVGAIKANGAAVGITKLVGKIENK